MCCGGRVVDEHAEQPVQGLLREVVGGVVGLADAGEVEQEEVFVLPGVAGYHGVTVDLPAGLFTVEGGVGVRATVPWGETFTFTGEHGAHFGMVGVRGVFEETKVGVGHHGVGAVVGVVAELTGTLPFAGFEEALAGEGTDPEGFAKVLEGGVQGGWRGVAMTGA